jgi:hypothetical protein
MLAILKQYNFHNSLQRMLQLQNSTWRTYFVRCSPVSEGICSAAEPGPGGSAHAQQVNALQGQQGVGVRALNDVAACAQ